MLDGGIEYGLFAIAMQEGDGRSGCYDAVVVRLQSLGSRKLITALKGLALGHQNVACAPVFVGSHDVQRLFLVFYVNVYYWFLDVGPYLDRYASVGHLDIALLQMQNLSERLLVESWRQADAETALLQQRVVLVERTATAQIEQHIALLYPYIHADITAAARHRFRRVLTG